MRRSARARSGVWFVAGLMIGVVMVSPAGAHIGDTITHLWNTHLRPLADLRYVNVGEKAGNADKLDGKDSGAFQDDLTMQVCPQGTTVIGIGATGEVACTGGLGPAAPAPTVASAVITVDEDARSVAVRVEGSAPPDSSVRFHIGDQAPYTCSPFEVWEMLGTLEGSEVDMEAQAGPSGDYDYQVAVVVPEEVWNLDLVMTALTGLHVEVDAFEGGQFPITLCSDPEPFSLVTA